MAAVGESPATVNYFSYDALLRRCVVQEASGVSYFTWDQNGMNLLAERDASGSVTAYYTHGYTSVDGIGSLVAAKRNEAGASYYQYPVYDHRGSVVRLLDENGTPTAYYEYDAWGKPLRDDVVGGTETNPFRYQSNWVRVTKDIYHSPTRLYHAGLGRFLGRDPRGKLAGDYSYGRHSPLHFGDPHGLVNECLCGPDVTAELKKVVANTKTTFRGWNRVKAASHCRALLSYAIAWKAWDIYQLRVPPPNDRDPNQGYNRTIAKERNDYTPPSPGLQCPHSVVVEEPRGKKRCWFAGSVNYVMWGAMMSLCRDLKMPIIKSSLEAHILWALQFSPRPGGPSRLPASIYSERAMLKYIDIRKKGFPNWLESREWAKLGYRGWPTVHTPLSSPNLVEPGHARPYGYKGAAPRACEVAKDHPVRRKPLQFIWLRRKRIRPVTESPVGGSLDVALLASMPWHNLYDYLTNEEDTATETIPSTTVPVTR